AFAQLASPVGGSQQGGAGEMTSRRAAAGQVAIPQAEPTPYQPMVIENAPVDPRAAPAPEAPDARARLTPPNEFESFVSSITGKPLRRFGADLLVPGARDFT